MMGAISYVGLPDGSEAVSEVAKWLDDVVDRVARQADAAGALGGQATTPPLVETEVPAVTEAARALLAAKYALPLGRAKIAEKAHVLRREAEGAQLPPIAQEEQALAAERGRALQAEEEAASTPEQMAMHEAAAREAREETARRSIEDAACEPAAQAALPKKAKVRRAAAALAVACAAFDESNTAQTQAALVDAADAWHAASTAVASPRVLGVKAALKAAELACARTFSEETQAALEDAIEAWVAACPQGFAKREEQEARREAREAARREQFAKREEQEARREAREAEQFAKREEQEARREAREAARREQLTSEEARQQAQAEGLTLVLAENTTGYFGVTLYKPGTLTKPYQARVWRGGKPVTLGSFTTAEEAALCVARSPEGQAAAAVPPPLTSDEARQQAQAEKLTLVLAKNTTGYFGVILPNPGKPKPYQARVRRGGKPVTLGTFATAEEAALCVARSPEGRAAAAVTPPPPRT